MMKTHRFASTVWNRLKQFAAHSGAAAATEFALIVPVLAGLVIAIDDYANVSVGTGEMQMASRSAIEYAMHGGTDMAAAQTLGMQAWNNRPANATMSVVSACLCGNNAAVCTAPCPNNTFPTQFVTVTASGTYGGNVFHATKQITDKVRIR